ncbi:MAG TPA: phospholipid carrier-dependent glycosyltransferase [Chloroflexia bacterium]|nr:phospholipid carrier-dependent glycosyltransferase [Chloroflexia bacterium]
MAEGRLEEDGARGRVVPAVILLLLGYGALGIVVQLRLISLVAEGFGGWGGLPLASSAPTVPSWLLPLQAHFDGLPWLPWAAWLLGVGLLVPGKRRTGATAGEALEHKSSGRSWQIALVLLLLMIVGGYVRMVELWPQSYGISQRPYDDEGVYAGSSQLFLQGILPYRDYFFAHPPVAAISYAPAMAFHFTEWGSPTSFMMARYLSVAYSLVTLALVFGAGLLLARLPGGIVSASLWALDGRVVEINRKIMLEGPMVLFSCAAILLYLWARSMLAPAGNGASSKRPLLVLGAAGVCAALSALTKIAGAACMAAILADMLWLALERRRLPDTRPSLPPFRLHLAAFLGGSIAAGLVVLLPFVLAAPSQFLRDAFFFQLLRPSDGVSDITLRLANLSSSLANPLTLVVGSLGFIVLTGMVWKNVASGPWRVAVLWTFFSLLLFTYSRSFYGHYYIQFAAPLCLLAAGVCMLPRLVVGRAEPPLRGRLAQATALVSVVLGVALLPLLAVEWLGVTAAHGDHDRVFELVGKYVSDAVPPGTQVLTTDEQFNFLAARPPSRNSTGYLIDSYGHMISLGLGLGTRDWGDLWAAALSGAHSNDVYAMIQRPLPQADILDRASLAPLVVVHDKGFSRLTPETVGALEKARKVVEQQARYTIYRQK